MVPQNYALMSTLMNSPGKIFRPCETLWESKFSFPSSTDTVLTAQTVTFEEKLEEANTLLERVRATLKELGTGVRKQTETKNGQYLDMICSFHGECQTFLPAPERPKTPEPEQAKTTEPQSTTAKKQSEQPKTIGKKTQEPLVQPKIVGKKPSKTQKHLEQTKTTDKKVACPIKCEKKKCDWKKECKMAESSKVSSGMLNPISEGSESSSVDKSEDDREFMMPVARLEKSVSPFNMYFDDRVPKVPTETRATSPVRNKVQSRGVSPFNLSEVSLYNPCEENEICKSSTSTTRSRNLSIQMMPSVSIRRSLIVQKTLQLSIKPTGSVVNELGENLNVGYEEVTVKEQPPKKLNEGDDGSSSAKVEQRSIKSKPPAQEDEDAMMLYRSFQIVDGMPYNTAPRSSHFSISTPYTMKHFNESSSLSGVCKENCTTCYRCKSAKNPWEIGLYKTVATQCSESRIERCSIESSKSTEISESSVEASTSRPTSKTSLKGSVPRTPSVSSASDEESDMPVRDSPMPSEETSLISGQNEKVEVVPEPAIEEKPSSTKMDSSSSDLSFTKEEPVKSQALHNPSTSSSTTSSSYTVRVSLDPSTISGRKVPAPAIVPDEEPIVMEKLTEPEKPNENEKSHDVKRDEHTQVSFPSSDGENVSEIESCQNPMDDFIRGLTETSEEHINKLRSSPSFPHYDLKSWSRTHMQLSNESKSEESKSTVEKSVPEKASPSDRPHLTVSYEEVMENSVNYDHHKDEEVGAKDKEVEVKDNEVEAKDKGEKENNEDVKVDTTNDKIVMTMFEERVGGGDEGMVQRKRLPFYRRMFSGKKMDLGQKSIDNSISEGEVKCKSTYSVGEIRPYKYHDVLKKIEKERFKTRRHQEDKKTPTSVAKERIEYNHWVAHYLLNTQNLPGVNDSSSSGETNTKN